MHNPDFIDWGTIEYAQAWHQQEEIFNKILETKKLGQSTEALQKVILCEHPHVYTLGKSGAENNLLVNQAFLDSIQATFFKTNRGGDITYHGPGQLVGYPILDLENYHLGLKDYVHLIEESIIQTIAEYGIVGTRLEGATGVWLDVGTPQARKICAIGVKASRYVTMHGYALNVNTDLSYFNHINPCGFVDKGVTSIQKELQKEVAMSEVKRVFERCFVELLNQRDF
ncbi:MAG: lipoyl(octanoyl) transferase LipB [Bacteroidales bacterium]|jgi:lipoyl(octanoyl) transferase|nr:lipoyl(octanoyl) transferase LipB [Bacteroidales bacterium]HHT52035.1 lipoyl(octanoyl) transferase LipB [Bacteroidales bacterium]